MFQNMQTISLRWSTLSKFSTRQTSTHQETWIALRIIIKTCSKIHHLSNISGRSPFCLHQKWATVMFIMFGELSQKLRKTFSISLAGKIIPKIRAHPSCKIMIIPSMETLFNGNSYLWINKNLEKELTHNTLFIRNKISIMGSE